MTPGLDKRDGEAIIRRIETLAASYTSEWRFNLEKPDMGTALACLFVRTLEETIEEYNRLPQMHFEEFMKAAGCRPAPARFAQGYMAFGLEKPDMPEAVVPAGCGVVSVGDEGGVSMETKEDVYVSAASVKIAGGVGIEAAKKGERKNGWLLLFDRPIQRGVISLLFLFKQQNGQGQSELIWEYYGAEGWTFLAVEDGTEGFVRTGIVKFAATSDFTKMCSGHGDGWCVRVYPAGGGVLSSEPPQVYMNGAAVTAKEGGTKGNLKPGASSRLKKTVGFVSKVSNPDYFYGGCEEESFEAAARRVCSGLRHGFRAVTPGDYERLIREVCNDAAKVKCFPGYDSQGMRKRGAVTLVVLLKDFIQAQSGFYKVREELETFFSDKAGGLVRGGQGLYITAPRFIRMDVNAVLAVKNHGLVMQAQEAASRILERFLDPVAGGYEGQGWELGMLPDYTQIKNLLRHVPGVSYIRQAACRCMEGIDGGREIEWEAASCFPWALPVPGICRADVEVG